MENPGVPPQLKEELIKKKLMQQQLEKEKEAFLKQILDIPAYERLMRIKIADEDFYNKVFLTLYQFYSLGKIRNKISDDELKQILKTLAPKKEFRIIRR